MVVCLDIGIIYMGYVYFFIKKFDEIMVWKWVLEGIMLLLKVFFFVLFILEFSFYFFGYDVERKFLDLYVKKDYKLWNFVNGFKMVLNEKKVFVYFNLINMIIMIFIWIRYRIVLILKNDIKFEIFIFILKY